jgi:hypothetical protein
VLYDATVSASQRAGRGRGRAARRGRGPGAAGPGLDAQRPAPDLAAERDRLGKRKRVEKLAVRYFKRRAGTAARPQPSDAVHYLNPEERRTLRRIERNAVLRAAAAGAFAATLGATVSVIARPLLGDEPSDPTGGTGCATTRSR